MSRFMRVLKAWYPLAFAVTVVCALAYAAVQQDYRQSANDPQIQMAEDAAAALAAGTAPQTLISSNTVDIGDSLAPYLVFYSASGTPIMGNGLLNGTLPNLPQGLFTYVAGAGEDHVTWQPTANIREAAVIVRVGGPDAEATGFVLASRSLREVELRESQLEVTTDIAWIIALVGTLILEAWVVLTR